MLDNTTLCVTFERGLQVLYEIQVQLSLNDVSRNKHNTTCFCIYACNVMDRTAFFVVFLFFPMIYEDSLLGNGPIVPPCILYRAL